jgi:transposase
MTMQFSFYPGHERGCGHPNDCPHLGGAAVGMLVQIANTGEESRLWIHRQFDAERKRNSELVAEVVRLEKALEQAQLELRLERQNKFATSKQKSELDDRKTPADPKKKTTGKRGAPVGHAGWHRKTPTQYDVRIDVPAPPLCQHCKTNNVAVYASQQPSEHLQEDIVDGQYHVTLFIHPSARCRDCRRWLQQAGAGEILGSRIGPHVRAMAVYLRNEIGVSYRKVSRAIEDLLGLNFTPAALIGFETWLSKQAQPIVEDIEKKIASTEGPVHADETYWTLDGNRAYYWVHTTDDYVHFQFEETRSGQVSRDILGEDFAGTLVTDCYSGYEAHSASAKQKCLAHLARTARDWQKLVKNNSSDFRFFDRIVAWVKRACGYHKKQNDWSVATRAKHRRWLEQELAALGRLKLKHEKAITLQGRITKHADSWLVFIADPRVPPTNNLAERTLRPLVIMRKICFGNRSRDGGRRLATIMSVKDTARRHGHNPLRLFYRLFTQPPDKVMRFLYKKTSAKKSLA